MTDQQKTIDQIFEILLRHDNELAVVNAKLDQLLRPVIADDASRESARALFAQYAGKSE